MLVLRAQELERNWAGCDLAEEAGMERWMAFDPDSGPMKGEMLAPSASSLNTGWSMAPVSAGCEYQSRRLEA